MKIEMCLTNTEQYKEGDPSTNRLNVEVKATELRERLV